MGRDEAPKAKREGLSPMGWVKVLVAGAAVSGALYKGSEYLMEHRAPSAAERVYQGMSPGVVVGIRAGGSSEDASHQMAEVTVRFDHEERTIPMPLRDAERFQAGEEVEVVFSLRQTDSGETQMRVDSIAPKGTST